MYRCICQHVAILFSVGNVVKKIRRGILNALICISKSTESMIVPRDSTGGVGGFV